MADTYDTSIPTKIIEILKPKIACIRGVEAVLAREPNPNDPTCSAYIVPGMRRIHDKCIGHNAPNRFNQMISVLVIYKASDQEDGQLMISGITENLWSLIYFDEELGQSLGQLEFPTLNKITRLHKSEVLSQNYSPQVSFQEYFVSMSSTNLQFDISVS